MTDLRKLLDEATPGPWECGKGAGWFIKREGRRAALMVGMRAEYSIISDGQVTERSSSGPECEANARLMALAPSLAAALLKAEEALKVVAAVLQAEKGRSGGKRFTGTWSIPALGVRSTVDEALDLADGALSEISKITGGPDAWT